MNFKITFQDSRYPGETFTKLMLGMSSENEARALFYDRVSDTASIVSVEAM
jgi:hypothetical protein